MARRLSRAAIGICIALLQHTFGAAPSAAAEPATVQKQPLVILFQGSQATPPAALSAAKAARQPPQRLHIELDGARAQAEDWLRQSGFALLEDRDADNRHSYELISKTTLVGWPALRLHARIGQSQLFAGMHTRRPIPALGVTLPKQQYLLQLECLNDQRFGWGMMGSLLWGDPHRQVQWGIALPLALGHEISLGALFQLRVRLDRPSTVSP